MSKSYNIFITGGNRGIGLEMVKQILVGIQPTNLFATCRKPNEAKELTDLASKYGNLHVIQLDILETEKFEDIVAKVSKITGDDGINLLINNSGILTKPSVGSIYNLQKDSLLEHLQVNTIAPIFLTKAFLPLLEKASARALALPMGIRKAAIVNVSTRVASIEDNTSGGSYSYRTSKTALNMATKCISLELMEKGILTILMHPGWVKTDLGGQNAPLTVEASASGIIKVLENLGEKDNGRFLQFDGKEIPW